MRILYLDIDTLRPDHLGCYGYHRNTSPNLDRLAAEGVRLEHCYVSDAPCLPSRASMFLGQFGIHSGVVNHGGLMADPLPIGRERQFRNDPTRPGFIPALRQAGLYPVSFSPFAERHSAWWFYQGWLEMINTGKGGGESAEEVVPQALEWIEANAQRDDWMLHINIWDPHTPYRAPEDFGYPFADEPLEGWYTEELRQQQWNSFGPGTPQEPGGNYGNPVKHSRQPDQVRSMDEYKKFVDGYDTGIRYADHWCGKILDALAAKGVLDDTVVIVTSDHGENMGEMGVIGDHAVADHITSRVPMIIRWPGQGGQGRVDTALHYQTDVAATIIELAGGKVPAHWDGQSFADAFRAEKDKGRDALVVSNCAWSCMRTVRWGDWLLARAYDTGLKNLPEFQLYNVAEDPHELNNLAEARPELVDHGLRLLEQWTQDMMRTSEHTVDPLWTVMAEGGAFHTRDRHKLYCDRLRATGRAHHAEFLEKNPTGIAR